MLAGDQPDAGWWGRPPLPLAFHRLCGGLALRSSAGPGGVGEDRACLCGAGGRRGGGAGSQEKKVGGGAAPVRLEPWLVFETDVAADVGDDFGDWPGADLVFEVERVEAVEEFGVQRFGLGGGGAPVDGVFDLSDDALAGGDAVGAG